jgi:hypothetical protein
MTHLEDLTPNAAVRGIVPDALVTVVSVQWFGSEALELTYKTPDGRVANVLLYRHDEARIEAVEHGRPWSFDGAGALFRLVSEAHRLPFPSDCIAPQPKSRTAIRSNASGGDSNLVQRPLRAASPV